MPPTNPPPADPSLVEHYQDFLDTVAECPPHVLRTVVQHLYTASENDMLETIMDIHHGTNTYTLLATLLVESATIRDPSITLSIAAVLCTQTPSTRDHN